MKGSGSTDLQCDRQCLESSTNEEARAAAEGGRGDRANAVRKKRRQYKEVGGTQAPARAGVWRSRAQLQCMPGLAWLLSTGGDAPSALTRQGPGLSPAQRQLALSTTAAARGGCSRPPCLCGGAWLQGWWCLEP